MELNIIYNENCLDGLKKLPDGCIDCCITSPPYYGLRQYLPNKSVILRNDLSEYEKTNIEKLLKEKGINPIF